MSETKGRWNMANRSRKHCVSIRVSDRELAAIRAKVKRSGLSLREYALRSLLGKEIHVKEGGLEVVKELKAIGNNVNQIAYHVNAGLITDCSPELSQMYSALKELMCEWQS
ncbi:plasmid mobilization protein [Christensenella hongkongensis]|nr:plasmid mobilization relaxosome protein MobC [Christensenella hongkongensis]